MAERSAARPSPRPARALLALALLTGCGAPAPPGPPRGAVLVVIDTLRADHLGCYGYERPTSPRIDALARDAVLFEQALAPSPWTLPSLATLMTSLPPALHGARAPSKVSDVRWLFDPEAFQVVNTLHGSRTTLAEILKGEGFATLGVVQGAYASALFGFDQGFDRYDDNHTPGIRFDVENVLRWLDDEAPERFFVYLHVIEVHSPYTPVEMEPGFELRRPDAPLEDYRRALHEERERFEAVDFDPAYRGPVNGSRADLSRIRRSGPMTPRDREHLVALYDRGISYVDHWVGELVAGLAARGLLDESVFVLTSDHGEEFFEHGRLEHGLAHYEESLRVPLIVRVPGEGRGLTVATPVGLDDVLPTVLDVLGVQAPPPASGTSLRPAWRGEPLPARPRVSEASIGGRSQGYRHDGWKYIREVRREELYDLGEDPGETRNRCAQRPDRCGELRDALASRNASLAARAAGLGLPDAERATLDDETRERLRALGYAE